MITRVRVLTAEMNVSLVHLCIRSAILIRTVLGILGAEMYSPDLLRT